MLSALRVVWRGLVEFERYGWLYVLANILAFALSLPVITTPAAFAGLSHMSHVAQTGHTTTMRDFWDGFRAGLVRGLIVGAANIVIIGILIANLSYYNTTSMLSSPVIQLLRIIWMVILIVWLAMQLYIWPLLDEMEPPTLYGAFRNAAVMTLRNPIFSLTLLLITGVTVFLSTITLAPWALITPSILACIANAAVSDRLALARLQALSISEQ